MQKKRTIVGSYCLKPRFDWAETKKPAQPTTQLSARGSWSQVSAFQHHNLPLTISPEHRTTYQKRQFGVIQAIRSHAKN